MKISILGLGYVGAVSAGCLAKDGHEIIGVDPNESKVNLINEGRSPIIEAEIEDIIRGAVVAGRLRATKELAEAISESEISMICVGTPSHSNGSLDLQYVNRVCEEIGLTKRSDADIAFCTTNTNIQRAENIKLIFEVKMSIVSNYKYLQQSDSLQYLGDYKSHKGNPSILRSDSMLKAIGKCINIRVSSNKSSNIPIIVLGNTPITQSYYSKVDHLKTDGIIQGFWSINPDPLDNNGVNIKQTPKNGFYKFDNLCKRFLQVILNVRFKIILSKAYIWKKSNFQKLVLFQVILNFVS